jgi:hypothetical protein
MARHAEESSLSVRVTSLARAVAADATLDAAGGRQIIVRRHWRRVLVQE